MKIPNYNLPMLTPEHFTAAHALEAHTRGVSASGLNMPDAPWGNQCTRFLGDGTPVDSGFVAAVLRHLSGNAKAVTDYIRKWEAHVLKVCSEDLMRYRL